MINFFICSYPLFSSLIRGTIAHFSANWVVTLFIHPSSACALPFKTASFVSVVYRLWLITHHLGVISARFKSACKPLASNTGVVSANVTMTTLVYFGFFKRGSNVLTLSGISPVESANS
jgi:hypothetical protein